MKSMMTWSMRLVCMLMTACLVFTCIPVTASGIEYSIPKASAPVEKGREPIVSSDGNYSVGDRAEETTDRAPEMNEMEMPIMSAEESDEPSLIPTLEIGYKNLSYSDSVYVLFAVGYENFDPDLYEIKMLFWRESRDDGYLYGSEDYYSSVRTETTIGETSYKVFYSKGIPAKNLIDNIYCRACVVIDGNVYYSTVLKYCPITYPRNVLLDETASEINKNLASSLLAYSAAAQIKFDHMTDDLATDTHYQVLIDRGVLDDGFPYGLYKSGTELNVTAVIPEGETFAKWIDGNGTTLGVTPELTFTVTSDMTLRAVYASEPESCDHVFGSWIEAADATCTEDGVIGHYNCSVCGRNFDAEYHFISVPVVIPSLGHAWEHIDAQEATCVDGWTAYDRCTRCGTETEHTILPGSGIHTYEETKVDPVGEARGYTLHECSVCGDSYRTDYDYSLYSGVDFSTEGKYAIPYNFDLSEYTIEASIQLDTSYSSRAGVIIGNYDKSNPGFNLEIYSGGKPRLFFYFTSSQKYDYIFTTDIRSEDVVNLAITFRHGEAELYLNGELRESIELADFIIPNIGRSLVLGGDNRTGNSQSFKGKIYSLSVFRDFRTPDEIVDDLVLADSLDADCCVSYNLLTSSGIIGGTVLEDIQESAQVTTAEELAYHASHGTRNIEVMNDITLDRTVYAISGVTIFSNTDVTITRAPSFLSDMFVVGENEYGRNLILDNITCVLSLGKAGSTGTLTIDGNKDNVTGEVYGSIVYINNSGTLNVHEGAVLTNNIKTANARTLGMQQYYGNMVGGAAIVNVNGVINMDGGLISNNETNFTDPGSGDTTNELYLQSCYGGAIFNNSNFNMTGGSIVGNSGYYGGAVANFQTTRIEAGLLENNYTSHAGGAIYNYNASMREIIIGYEDIDPDLHDEVIFRGNYTTMSSGGAIYSGNNCELLIYGGVTFDSNSTRGNGGAISLSNVANISNAVFTDNSCGGKGGAVYFTLSGEDERIIRVNDSAFPGHSAHYGGAVAVEGTNVYLTDCVINGNESNYHGGAVYTNYASGNVGAVVNISGGTINDNDAGGEAGALFGDAYCSVTVSGTTIQGNESVGNGGAISVHGTTLSLSGVNLINNQNGTVTTTNPDTAETTYTYGNGGAVYISYRTVTDSTDPDNPVSVKIESNVTATNCTFSNNHSDGLGGSVMALSGTNEGTILTLTGCTLQNGTSDDHGGAVVVSYASVVMNNNTFSGNSTGKNGGAVYAHATSTLTGAGNIFNGNSASTAPNGGGAVYSSNSTVTLSNSTFVGNTTNTDGGAVCAYSGTTMTLTDVTATGNTARNGGFAYAATSGTVLTVTASSGSRNTVGSTTVSSDGNTATGGGGGVYGSTGSEVNVSKTDFCYNNSYSSGGTLYLYSASGTFTDCTVSRSIAGSTGGDGYGGAMMVGYGSNAVLTDCEFTDNSATMWAGALYIRHKNASGDDPAEASTVTATNTLFEDNTAQIGGAVYIREYCTFTANGCSFIANSATEGDGGAVYNGGTLTVTDDSRVQANVVNSVFEENTASAAGGAIYIAGGKSASLNGAVVSENTAGTTGGAVYLETGASLTTTGGTEFNTNSSVGIGGAIYSNSAVIDLTDTDFSSNSVTGSSAWYGGAIYTNGASAATITRCGFTGNNNTHGTGGAICARGTGSLTVTDSSFSSNYSSGTGGAIHVFGITAAITDTDFFNNSSTGSTGGAIQVGKENADGTFLTVNGGIFSGNQATGGGAIYVKNGTRCDLIGVTMSENTAGSTGGGAVFAEQSSTLNISGSELSENTTTGSGGAVYVKENVACTITDTLINTNTAGYGGGMIIYGGNVTITGGEISGNTGSTSYGAIYLRPGAGSPAEQGRLTVTGTVFDSNTSASNGGAVGINTSSSMTVYGATFSNNTSSGGGAIYLIGATSSFTADSYTYTDPDSNEEVTDRTVFSENSTTGQGGAIYSNGGPLNISNTLFDANCGKGNGSYYAGAVYINNSTNAIITNCEFTDNYNEKYQGGAITARSTSSLTVSGSTFTGNHCNTDGGAISGFESATITVTGCSFTDNSAKNGGAIAVKDTVTLTVNGTSVFTSNSATSTGGAVYLYIDGTNAVFNAVTFDGNSATGNGGAVYHSNATNMTWTSVAAINNASDGNGDVVYVTNGSGKTTSFVINSAAFTQNGGDPIKIGNNNAFVTVHKPGITDTYHSPVDFSLLFTATSTGLLANYTYLED